MNIPLKKHQADWITGQISAGRYASEAEAIEDALSAKIREDEAAWAADGEYHRQRLLQAEDDIREGRVVEADDAFWESLDALIDEAAADSRT